MYACVCSCVHVCGWMCILYAYMCLCVAENACVNAHCIFTFECMDFYMCAPDSVYILCLHVYVYLGVGVCVCMFVLFACICACIHIYICACVHVCLCLCVHLYVCIYEFMCVRM